MEFKPKKKVYLANAYSSRLSDPDTARFQQLCRRNLESFVGGVLRKKHGVTFFLPIAQSAAMSDICSFDTGFSEWEGDDFTWIDACDEVWVLMSEGWDKSIGVLAEIEFAKEHQKLIRYIHPTTLEVD